MAQRWMVCSACRKDIPYSTAYYACSVSTCNRAATRLVFCSIACWDSHVAILRHRDAWAVEERSPPFSGGSSPRPPAPATTPATTTVPAPRPAPTPAPSAAPTPAPTPAQTSGPTRTIVTSTGTGANSSGSTGATALSPADESDILIVVSKLKKYIRDRSGMNASDAIAERLSDHVRTLCDAAIRAAGQDGRKTVLERDIPIVRR